MTKQRPRAVCTHPETLMLPCCLSPAWLHHHALLPHSQLPPQTICTIIHPLLRTHLCLHVSMHVATGVFNNIAVAAAHALEARGLNRVAIVDFDVHHGERSHTCVGAGAEGHSCSVGGIDVRCRLHLVVMATNSLRLSLPVTAYSRKQAILIGV